MIKLSSVLPSLSKKSSSLRKLLPFAHGTYRFFLLLVFVGLAFVGIGLLFFSHPSDNLTKDFYEIWPRWQWFVFFLLASVAAMYGLSAVIRYREYGSSRFKYARDFFICSLLQLLVVLMIITCFHLLYVRDAFDDEVILRTDLIAHYLVILWDAVTINLTDQWQSHLPAEIGFTSLQYEQGGFYGGSVWIFKVAVIITTTWSVHKYQTFKTPEERSEELKKQILQETSEE